MKNVTKNICKTKEHKQGSNHLIIIMCILLALMVIINICDPFQFFNDIIYRELSHLILSNIIVINILVILIYLCSERKLKIRYIIPRAIILYIIFGMLLTYSNIQISESRKVWGTNNKKSKTSLIDYEIAVFQDAIKNKTTTEKISVNSIMLVTGRKRFSPSIQYRATNNMYYYSARVNLHIFQIVKDLKYCENEMTIEYYNNSKIIKTIDGIHISDYTKIAERVRFLQEQKQKEVEQKKIEKEKIEQEEEQKKLEESKRKSELTKFSNVVGKDINSLKKVFEENNINYSIKYVNSKYGKINTVIFCEWTKQYTLYVINSNNSEDMVEFPQLKIGMTKEEIKEILDKNGIDYKFYSTIHTTDSNKSNTLVRIPIKEKTIIPKSSQVGIELYVYP